MYYLMNKLRFTIFWEYCPVLMKNYSLADSNSTSISFERSIALCWKILRRKGPVCVCVSRYNEQAVTGQLLIREMHSSLMLLCPTKLGIREGSIHWPWMCSNNGFLCQWILWSFFHIAVRFDYMLQNFLSFYGNWAKPQTQHAESCEFRTQ